MVHKAKTLVSIRDAAKKAGVKLVVEGGRSPTASTPQNAEVCGPVVLGRVTPETRVRVDWDGKEKEIALATTEFFMPILCTMETASFDDFIRFSLTVNPHDLATSLWTRDDVKLQRARRVLGGMLKENDGTDSALEWEEFGASGVGDSGNTGVGDAVTTIAMFCRKQKGRHFTFRKVCSARASAAPASHRGPVTGEPRTPPAFVRRDAMNPGRSAARSRLRPNQVRVRSLKGSLSAPFRPGELAGKRRLTAVTMFIWASASLRRYRSPSTRSSRPLR